MGSQPIWWAWRLAWKPQEVERERLFPSPQSGAPIAVVARHNRTAAAQPAGRLSHISFGEKSCSSRGGSLISCLGYYQLPEKKLSKSHHCRDAGLTLTPA